MEDSSQWRLSTTNGIPYRLIDQSGGFAYEDSSVTRIYLIDSANLAAFAAELFPGAVYVPGLFYYPLQPTILGTLVPKSMRWKRFIEGLPVDPFGNDTEAPDGTYCQYLEVTVDFGTVPANGQEQNPNNPFTFLEVSSSSSGTFLATQMPGDAKWINPTSGAEEEVKDRDLPFHVTEPITEWTVHWPQIPWQFWTDELIGRLREAEGKVNSHAMPLFIDAPPDTILFLSYDHRQSFTWRSGFVGESPIDLTMKFVEKNFDVTEDVITGAAGELGGDWESTTASTTIHVTHQHLYRPAEDDDDISAVVGDVDLGDYVAAAAAAQPGWRQLQVDGRDLYEQTDLNSLWSPT